MSSRAAEAGVRENLGGNSGPFLVLVVLGRGLETRVCITSMHATARNHMTEPIAQLVLRKRAVCRLLGISPATLDRLRARGDFPPALRISDQLIGWPTTAIELWVDQRAREVQ